MSKRVCFWNETVGLKGFIGNGKEGNSDGKALKCEFFQPTGLCAEFNNVVYVADYRTSCIKVFSTMKHTSEFLAAIGKLMRAFSIHEKNERYELKSLDEAIEMVAECLQKIETFVNNIREDYQNKKVLTGADGSVSSKSFVSLELTLWALKRLAAITKEQNYKNTNMLSLMTLSVEHLHATSHIKQPLMSQLQYARDFMSTMKESIKRYSNWSAFYFTSRKASWYPPAENTVCLNEVLDDLPKKKTPTKINQIDQEALQNWALTYTRAVRQRTVRQETTMAKMGTLPHYLYTQDTQEIARSIVPYYNQHKENSEHNRNQQNVSPGENHEGLTNDQKELETEVEHQEVEEIDEFSEESDTEEENSGLADLDDAAIFLVGRASRFGRAIKINNKYLE